jgi:pilus assembly protein Flp/PilA
MTHLIDRFVKEDEGQDLIEYAMVGGLIALGAVAAVTAFQGELSALYTRIKTKLSTVATT